MLQLLQGSELYLISRVENDEEQAVPPFLPRPALEPAPAARPRSACDAQSRWQRVAQALREAGAVGQTATDAGKAVALFCSSALGLTSMVRQLEPDLHIDGSAENLRCAAAAVSFCPSPRLRC